jgi:hypothetical protein
MGKTITRLTHGSADMKKWGTLLLEKAGGNTTIHPSLISHCKEGSPYLPLNRGQHNRSVIKIAVQESVEGTINGGESASAPPSRTK